MQCVNGSVDLVDALERVSHVVVDGQVAGHVRIHQLGHVRPAQAYADQSRYILETVVLYTTRHIPCIGDRGWRVVDQVINGERISRLVDRWVQNHYLYT